MKLLYIANSRIPTTKAHGFQTVKMCEAFSNAGIEVELWIPRRVNPIKDNLFTYYNVRETFAVRKIAIIDLMPLLRYIKCLGFIVNFIGSASFAFFALLQLCGEKTDIIYSRDQFVGWFLSFSNRKFIYEIHSFPKNARLYAKMWRCAHRIIAITQGLKDLLISHSVNQNKIIVASDAVDLTAFNAISQTKDELKTELGLPSGFLIGYIGKFKTLGMEKGVKTMIGSLPLVDDEAKMVFVGGDQDEIKKYKSLANRFNAASKCIFVDYQPRTKAIKYIKAMDVLIIPFPNEPHYAFYASPLKLFEYMASGRPIIASDLPALKEILNDKNALFFRPGDTGDLARAVKMIKSSSTLSYHLSQQALADVKNYTWDNRAKKIIDFMSI